MGFFWVVDVYWVRLIDCKMEIGKWCMVGRVWDYRVVVGF